MRESVRVRVCGCVVDVDVSHLRHVGQHDLDDARLCVHLVLLLVGLWRHHYVTRRRHANVDSRAVADGDGSVGANGSVHDEEALHGGVVVHCTSLRRQL